MSWQNGLTSGGHYITKFIEGAGAVLSLSALAFFFIPFLTFIHSWLPLVVLVTSFVVGVLAVVAAYREDTIYEASWLEKIRRYVTGYNSKSNRQEQPKPMKDWLVEFYNSLLRPFLFIADAVFGGVCTLMQLCGFSITPAVLTLIISLTVTITVLGVLLSLIKKDWCDDGFTKAIYFLHCMVKLIEGVGELLAIAALVFYFIAPVILIHSSIHIVILGSSFVLGMLSMYNALKDEQAQDVFNERYVSKSILLDHFSYLSDFLGSVEDNEHQALDTLLKQLTPKNNKSILQYSLHWLNEEVYVGFIQPFLVNAGAVFGIAWMLLFLDGVVMTTVVLILISVISVFSGFVGVLIFRGGARFRAVDLKRESMALLHANYDRPDDLSPKEERKYLKSDADSDWRYGVEIQRVDDDNNNNNTLVAGSTGNELQGLP